MVEGANLVRGSWWVACEDRLLLALGYPYQIAALHVLILVLWAIFIGWLFGDTFTCNIQTE